MALIDRMIQAIYKYHAEELVLATGEKVTLAIGESRRPVSAEAATKQQIEVLLREIVPGHLAPEVGREGDHEFPYESPSGAVRVRVERGEGFLRIRAIPLILDDELEPEAETPVPPRTAASPASPAAGAVSADADDSEDRQEVATTRMIATPSLLASYPPPAAPRDPSPASNAGVAPFAEPAAPAPSGSPAAGDESFASRTAPLSAAAPEPAPVAAPWGESVDSDRAGAMDDLFMKMVQEGCSDLHLSTGNPPLFRKDGEIVPLGDGALLTEGEVRDLVLSITPRLKREEFEATHDTDFAHEVPAVGRFRCNLFLDRMGIGGVFRQIPMKIPTADELGLSKQILQLCELTKGLVLVTGPTGSGKSTTLAALIDHINRNRTAHIITIEDPIEFVHANQKCLINQREVGTHTEGFKEALRAALREDPDCILVGEMRDLETIAIAIETAETGHLVFGTLHTNTAASTVDRMIDQFPADRQSQVRTMLSESLKGVLSQTLCKKKGGGRVAALEVLFVTAAVSNLIREGKAFQIPSIMQTGKGLGMVTLNDALMELVQKGVVSPKEAYFKSVAKTEMKSLLERNSFKIDAA
jgi:twitching motility protein PilT